MPELQIEDPITGAVYHCERRLDRESYQVGLELADREFLGEADREKAEKRLDDLLNGMRSMFMGAWEDTHR